MNKEIVALSRLVDLEDYPKDILNKVCECLKIIFSSSDIRYHKSIIKGNKRGFYLPVIVNGKNIGYYEIIGIKNKLTKDEINVILSLLLQFHTKLDAFNYSTNDNVLLHDMADFDVYQASLNSNDIMKINCLFIRINDYNETFVLLGDEYAKNMMKAVVNKVIESFSSSKDIVFKYSDNQIVIYTVNQTNSVVVNRINELKNKLCNLNIDIKYGMASSYDVCDMSSLTLLAEHNMYFPVNTHNISK